MLKQSSAAFFRAVLRHKDAAKSESEAVLKAPVELDARLLGKVAGGGVPPRKATGPVGGW